MSINILRTCKNLLGLIDGTIQSISISAAGTGYTAGSIAVTDPVAGGADFAATYTVDADGAIDSITISNNGTGYSAGLTVAPSDAGNGDASLIAVMGATTKDDLLNFYIDSIEAWLLQYLNRTSVPAGLEYWVVKKVIAQYNQDGGSAAGGSGGDVLEVQRGDTRIKYGTSGAGFAGVAASWMSDSDLLTLQPFKVVRFT